MSILQKLRRWLWSDPFLPKLQKLEKEHSKGG